jgi:hypothetical protein
MTGSLIFTIKAIKRLPEAAIHTPIRFLQIHVDFLNFSFVLRPKKKMKSGTEAYKYIWQRRKSLSAGGTTVIIICKIIPNLN